jgi:type III pantothenate kinase
LPKILQVVQFVIDIGNTHFKVAVFVSNTIIESRSGKKSPETLLPDLIKKYGTPQSTIVSTVKDESETLISALEHLSPGRVFRFRGGLKLPVRVAYKTPETLGTDRLANAIGAWFRYPNKNCLVVDLGTCVKYDLVTSDSRYHGGLISPGLKMRYQALTRFTARLPYYRVQPEFPELIGSSTEGSIRSGVEQGLRAEIDGIITEINIQYNDLQVIVTGGDSIKFVEILKNPIFVAPNLTLEGLKVILDYNDH